MPVVYRQFSAGLVKQQLPPTCRRAIAVTQAGDQTNMSLSRTCNELSTYARSKMPWCFYGLEDVQPAEFLCPSRDRCHVGLLPQTPVSRTAMMPGGE